MTQVVKMLHFLYLIHRDRHAIVLRTFSVSHPKCSYVQMLATIKALAHVKVKADHLHLHTSFLHPGLWNSVLQGMECGSDNGSPPNHIKTITSSVPIYLIWWKIDKQWAIQNLYCVAERRGQLISVSHGWGIRICDKKIDSNYSLSLRTEIDLFSGTAFCMNCLYSNMFLF